MAPALARSQHGLEEIAETSAAGEAPRANFIDSTSRGKQLVHCWYSFTSEPLAHPARSMISIEATNTSTNHWTTQPLGMDTERSQASSWLAASC